MKTKEQSILERRVTCANRNKQGECIGPVTQYLVIVSYAVACNKPRGLTLPIAIAHSTNKFVSGFIFMAVSRVTSAGHLQLLNSKPVIREKFPKKTSKL